MEILRKIHMNSGDTVNTQDNRHLEKLEVILSVLEDKYRKHNSTLNEVKNKVVTLLEKVGELTTDIKSIQRYTFNTKSRDVKVEKTTGQGDNLRNTTIVNNFEQCKAIENSSKTNEDFEELYEDGVSVDSIESTNRHFECGISSHTSGVQAHSGRRNQFENKENPSSENAQTYWNTNDTCNKDNPLSEEIKVKRKTYDSENTEKIFSAKTQSDDSYNKHILASAGTQLDEITNDSDIKGSKNVSLGTNLSHQCLQSDDYIQANIPNQPFAGKTPNEIDQTETERKHRTELEDKRSSRNVNMVCRNDFGYKRKRSEMSSDNRVAYHSNDTCFQGNNIKSDVQLPTEPIPSSNIKAESFLAERMSDMRKVSPKSKMYEFVEDQVYGIDPENISQPRNIREWLAYSEQLRINSLVKLQSGTIQRGSHGHDITLVIDCSGRMRGKKFTTMIEAAKEYVNGIKQVKRTRLLEDNIGLAVFGGTSGLIVESTSNYDLVLEQISQLRPEGEAPLVGGLLMGLAGVLGAGGTSQILETEVPGYIIVFTDEMCGKTSTDKEKEFGIDPSYLTGNFHKQAEMSGILLQIASHSIKIFYVPIGENIRNEVMETAVRETKGKIIHLYELHRLIKLTQVLILAAQVASDLRHTNPHPTAEDVRLRIYQRTSNPDDAHDDCVDLVLEFVKPMSSERNRGLYNELVCRTLQLGDRVRRGPDWRFEEQDSGLAGTVVGQEPGTKAVWVEWDSGHLNGYIYDELNNIYSIKKVYEPRVLFDEMVAVGCKVTRGNDWTYDDADGGPGTIGTVLKVKQDGSVAVRWKFKNTGEYKMGKNGLFEIQICNDSSTSQPTYSADITSNKYQSGECSFEHYDTDRLKTTHTADTEQSREQERVHYDEYVLNVNNESVNVSWEHEDGTEWKRYTQNINAKIEKAYQRKKVGKTILQFEKETYLINFKTMVKENSKTKKRIRVRRIGGKKPRTDTNSYRGISLVPSIAKIFEKLLENELTKLRPDFPNHQQVAYQKQLSSMNASYNLQEVKFHHIEKGGPVKIVLLDSTKAFDTVPHDGLRIKLYEYGIPAKLWCLLDNMYSDLTSAVFSGGKLSNWFKLHRGVRQGSVLSAKLCLIFINDLIDILKSC
ncbi:Hypothetical predicted protein [Mytilus galloprovincialis]|nr:Hypothetical predicted protein [Mytilus galloprovincialis]